MYFILAKRREHLPHLQRITCQRHEEREGVLTAMMILLVNLLFVSYDDLELANIKISYQLEDDKLDQHQLQQHHRDVQGRTA